MSDCSPKAILVSTPCPPEAVLVPQQQPIEVVTRILRGPPGPPGQNMVVTANAGENIASFELVYVSNNQAFVASQEDLSNLDKFAGVSLFSVTTGQVTNIQTDGEVQNPLWNFSSGFVWLGTNGQVTQTPPVPNNTIYRVLLGVAVSPVKLLLRISEPISYNI